jgi:DNA-binding response OmpR family regulator
MPTPLHPSDHVSSGEASIDSTGDVFAQLQPSVLIADDSDDTREMFRTLLEMKGYRVLEARDGQEAIDVTVRENPGLVLLDLGLPRLNGLSVIRRLRKELKVVNVPLVVITGYDKHFETAMAAGCDDYLLKPVDFDRLDTILDYYVPTKARAISA